MSLSVEDLTLRRGGRRVVEGVSLSVRAGEIVAVVGTNGAGKTSLLESILGVHRLERGRVTWEGAALATLPARSRVFSYLPDEAEPASEVPVRILVEHARRWGGAPPDVAGELFERLGIGALSGAQAGELSRGEKRRVNLFIALCTARPVLVLDEPFGTFDPLQLVDVLDVVRTRARAGAAFLITIHQMSEAEKIADRIVILHRGRVLASGTLDELRARAGAPTLEAAFLALLRRGDAAA